MKTCNHEGCTNQTYRGGTCQRHRPRVECRIRGVFFDNPDTNPEKCTHENCDNLALSRGLCHEHRVKCIHPGCDNGVAAGREKCVEHGPRCSQPGCINAHLIRETGLCRKHAKQVRSKRVECNIEGCNHVAKTVEGTCAKHGPDYKPTKEEICNHENCENVATSRHKCVDHQPRCSHPGCTKSVEARGKCWSHDEERASLSCVYDGCTNKVQSISTGLCKKHGLVKKKHCKHDGCKLVATTGGLCKKHAEEEATQEQDKKLESMLVRVNDKLQNPKNKKRGRPKKDEESDKPGKKNAGRPDKVVDAVVKKTGKRLKSVGEDNEMQAPKKGKPGGPRTAESDKPIFWYGCDKPSKRKAGRPDKVVYDVVKKAGKRLKSTSVGQDNELHGRTKPNNKRLPCIHEGCTNRRKRAGYCVKHDPEKTACNFTWENDGKRVCNNQAVRRGKCVKHDAEARGDTEFQCTYEGGCTTYLNKKGAVCRQHSLKKSFVCGTST